MTARHLPTLVTLVALAWATPLRAQAGGQEEPDSVRARVLERLRGLSEPVRLDSAALLADSDSVARPDPRAGAAPGGPGRPAAPVASGDSILAALLGLPGYATTEYEGVSAEFDAARRRLVLLGTPEIRARVSREGELLTSDSAVVYDETRGIIRSAGEEAVYTPVRGNPLTSRSLIFDVEAERGSALGARTEYSEGGNWIVWGDLPSVEEDLAYGSHARFTSCDLETPHYHFLAGQVKIHNGRMLVARPVTLYFADVPVAWLPFIAQSLAQGRSSGLLTPRFSVNDIVRTSGGYRRRISNIGFYWAMSDYTDATIALDWFSDEFLSLSGGFRYNWLRQFLRGSLDYRQYWREDGSRELAFDTRHSWEISERTQLRVSGRYASSTDFVRRNSFDPREVTQSIDSDGGINHRFDWGSLSLSANRKQFLSDDRVTMTLPSVNLSLSPITFFQAPPSRAGWFNNVTWSGSGNFTRSTDDRVAQADSSFSLSRADQETMRAGFSSSVNLGNFSWSQSVNLSEATTLGVPLSVLEPEDPVDATAPLARWLPGGFQATAADLERLRAQEGARDLSRADLTWSTSLDYQQRLIGSTTLTPRLTVSGNAVRSDLLADSIPEASGFVNAPPRISFGAGLKTDVYGFFPGFAGFERVRHKISPSFDYSYTPEVTSSPLQRTVFPGELQTRNEIRIGLNQTFEAKRPVDETAPAPEEPELPADSFEVALAPGADTLGPFGPDPEVGVEGPGSPGGLGGPPASPGSQGQIVRLLAINTSAVTYDFVQADSTGRWEDGFRTMRLSNQISSDFFRGLTLSVEHDLFDLSDDGSGGTGGGTPRRRFAPHLSQLNMGFSIGSSSSLVRALGFLGSGEEDEEAAERQTDALDPDLDESSIVPGSNDRGFPAEDETPFNRNQGRQQAGGWTANLSYSLRRPREEDIPTDQMIQASLNFNPTQQWDVSWRTSYDLEAGRFNDHIIRLSRDLHRWEANFDFRQTATGNWTFRFEVALIDNRDLHFDYEQRSLDRRP